MSWLTAPVLWLGWAVLFLSFGMYAVFEWLCGGFYKYQNLRTRYKAEWALVTGASSGRVTWDFIQQFTACCTYCYFIDALMPHLS